MIPPPEVSLTAKARLRHPRTGAGAILVVGGLLAMVVGGGALLLRQHAAQTWSGTDEADRAARQMAAPTPRWIDEMSPPPGPRAVPTATRRPASSTSAATPPPSATPAAIPRPAAPPGAAWRSAPASDSDLESPVDATTVAVPDPPAAPKEASSPEAPPTEADPDDEPTVSQIGVTGSARAPADAVEIVGSEFRFLDPPEPGARARLGLQLLNHADLPTGPLRLTLSTRWLSGWRVVDADPTVLDDRVRDGSRRTFDFAGLDANGEGAIELQLVATDDAVDPPELRLSLARNAPAPTVPDVGQADADGAEIGRARPETVAPRPRPGPARSIEIPRLGLRAAVVPTTWEPPSFVVGQLRLTANLSEGNTVLIGHLNGLAGNVFAHLDRLEPGDEIIATSRGLEYRFVVSETMTLPGDDSVPLQPTDEPRLTLMTCAGDWDPIGLDYSHRLWVVAEPPELAESTLTGATPGPLSRQLGLAPPLSLLPPLDLGPPPKLAEPAPPDSEAYALPAPAPAPSTVILEPTDGAEVDGAVVVRGRRIAGADAAEPLWLVVRAEIEGSRWYPYSAPLTTRPDGAWEASLEIGGGPGIRHSIVVAAVDAATDARLRRHVAQRPGQPLAILPDAFEAGARIVVRRR